MTVVLMTAPAVGPISLAEAKAHLKFDASDEDALLTALITAARMFVERTLGVALITQSWSYFLDFWPSAGCITLPILPVQSVSAVKVHDGVGGSVTLDAASYAVDALSEPARLVLKGAVPSTQARELNAFEVAFTAGYGDAADNVPGPIRHALKLLVAHWFERREPVALGLVAQDVPTTIAALLLPYRRVTAMTEFLPSELRHRLTLEQLERVSDDGGGFTESWVEVATLWCDLRPLAGSETVEADRTRRLHQPRDRAALFARRPACDALPRRCARISHRQRHQCR